MIEKMTVKERLMAAIRCQDVDYTPMEIHFWPEPAHEKVTWKSERERLETYRKWGWDTRINIGTPVTPDKKVKTSLEYRTVDGVTVLKQMWDTPAGRLEEQLKVTGDWPQALNRKTNQDFFSDFRTARYIEYPFKELKDLDTLEYLFPLTNDLDVDTIVKDFREKKQLSEEFQVPLLVYLDAGMDWLLWLFSAEEAVMRMVETPEFVDKLISRINAAKLKRLEVLLELGVDGVIRRGWYETTDFWSPAIFREHIKPAVESLTETVHQAGVPLIYLMNTGIMPLLPELSGMSFDCLLGPEPEMAGHDLTAIHRMLPGKSIWGGISGPNHLGAGTPENTEKAVQRAFEIIGRKGLILSPGVGYRPYWSWENMDACEKAWKRYRA